MTDETTNTGDSEVIESANTDDETVADLPPSEESEGDTFPRAYVEDLRQENGKYRQRAQQAEQFAQRLHIEVVRATGRLADPTDIPFDETHLDDPAALTAAIDDLLAEKPHLASRRPTGDIGQGNLGPTAESFSLLGLLKQHT
jgi:hypothetical protein